MLLWIYAISLDALVKYAVPSHAFRVDDMDRTLLIIRDVELRIFEMSARTLCPCP